MKTAVISFYEGYPPDSGAASVTWNCAKHADGERFLVQVGGDRRSEGTADGVQVHTLPGASSRLKKLLGLRQSVARITELCREIGPDVVFLEGASWAVYHAMLIRSLRRAGIRALIAYHAHNVEYVLRRQKHGRLVAGLTRWAEGRVFREADVTFAVSEVDRRQVEELYGIRPHLMANGVDVAAFGRTRDADVQDVRSKYGLDGQTVLFMGFYAYRPNTEAVDLLVSRIFPRILQRNPGARLAVLGSEIPYKEPWIVNPGRISYEDLPAFVAACTVGVAPIRSGSGTRLKILEYLAAGLPVVSTAKGAEGLDLRDGEHLVLAEDDQVFGDAVLRLLEDEPLRRSLAERGRAFVEENYAWPRIMSRCWAIIEKRLSKRKQ